MIYNDTRAWNVFDQNFALIPSTFFLLTKNIFFSLNNKKKIARYK